MSNKFARLLALLIALALVATACGSSSDGDSASEADEGSALSSDSGDDEEAMDDIGSYLAIDIEDYITKGNMYLIVIFDNNKAFEAND